MQLHDFIWAQTRDRQHFQHARWNVCPHSFQRRSGTGLAKLSDHACYGITHARDLLKTLLCHQIMERLRHQSYTFSCSEVSLRSMWITAIEHGTTAKLI